ncbi:GxxExxY protein [Leptolyngbya sp. 7M]|uniref:GxxExxY protein n=1 Tax=Leptolyngbya sp. 7M TaxID=2812896 RepID=UPI001B8C1F28|nr:GxxExxY protein [Leptolyngbya sp. 7M]QYO64733.1 GxxExxY protein [Leptolyngbya sp. 7M]QYU69624.1 GxxExxY protein [Leptolyngbya sp. 15MV]
MDLEAIAKTVVDRGYHLHRDTGPGMLETVYEVLLTESLRDAGFRCRRQVPVPIRYKGVVVDNAFKIDLLVEEVLIIELKSTERISPVHGKQVLTYLRLMNLPLGFVMNFGQTTFKAGLQRVANDYFGRIG